MGTGAGGRRELDNDDAGAALLLVADESDVAVRGGRNESGAWRVLALSVVLDDGAATDVDSGL